MTTNNEGVIIAVVTRQRPLELRRLLVALEELYGSREDVRLLVVENEAQTSVTGIIAEAAPTLSRRTTHALEATPGYSAVRNAALRRMGDADALVFIDDDEVPEPGWLDALVEAQRQLGADVVAGPVVPVLPEDAGADVVASGVFAADQPDLAEGVEMRWCASNNTLVTARAVRLVPEGFDPRFNRSGGEDSHFFSLVTVRGGTIRWTRAATVREFITSDRLSARWVWRRAWRSGRTRAEVELTHFPSAMSVATRAAKASGQVVIGSVRFAVGKVIRERGQALRGVQLAATGLGSWRGLFFAAATTWRPRSQSQRQRSD
ncbi:MAG TPA: glycosyltransferase family 2 protein [Baekduia sp.]